MKKDDEKKDDEKKDDKKVGLPQDLTDANQDGYADQEDF